MTSTAFHRALRAAAFALLLPCAAMAATPRAESGARIPGKPQLGAPVTPISIDVDLRTLPRAKAWQPGMGIREAHRRYYPSSTTKLAHAPADKPTARDGLPELQQIWDESIPQQERTRRKALSRTRVTIDNGNTGVSPADPVIEVGTDHVIYAVNGNPDTTFNIYTKSGTLLAGPIAFTSFAPTGSPCKNSVSDPIVLFDRIANRWFMLEMGGSSSNYQLCTYVSKTSDPVTGGWWFYGFSTPTLPDYPHCGVWNNAYVCANNEGGANVSVYAFDRANMLNGATARPAQRFTTVPRLSGYGFQALTPSTFYGTNAAPAGAPQILARHRDDEAHDGASANATQDFIELFTMNIDWNTPANSNIGSLPRIPITEFNSWFRDYSTFATVPQPGSTSRLDPIREVILNQLVYRNLGTHEALVGTFATNQDPARTGTVVDSGVRWFELRRTGGGNWTLHQEGTFSPGDTSTHHLMGTAAMDKFGNIGLGYNVTKTSTPTKFASLLYTGRLATDPLGVMTLPETETATGAAVETSGRWGDYYQMTVDPVDDCTFWFVGMYRPAGSWQTRASDFRFPGCSGAGATYAITGTITTSAGGPLGGVNVSNGSASVTTNASGQYAFTGLASGTYTLTPTLSGFTFSPATRSVTISGADVTGQNFTGTGSGGGTGTTYTNGTDVAIRDRRTVSSPIVVSGRTGNGSSTTPVAVTILHTYIGDLTVDLVAPDGSVYNLHNRTGGAADNIITTYTVNLSSEPLNGTWNLRINDAVRGDTGTLDTWSITF